jgi:hypothetical protein
VGSLRSWQTMTEAYRQHLNRTRYTPSENTATEEVTAA